jgi:hypothetical protein
MVVIHQEIKYPLSSWDKDFKFPHALGLTAVFKEI